MCLCRQRNVLYTQNHLLSRRSGKGVLGYNRLGDGITIIKLDRKALETMALRNPDPKTRLAAVAALDEKRSRVAIEMVALRDPAAALRELAIGKLSRRESCEVLKAVALGDEDMFLKIFAAERLDPAKDRIVLEKLKSMGVGYLTRQARKMLRTKPIRDGRKRKPKLRVL